MKTTIHYSEKMTLCVHGLGLTATIDLGCTSLASALEYVERIFNDKTFFYGDSIESIHVIDSKTGELIAECEPNEEINDDAESWPTPEEIFEDRGYY